MHPNPAFRQTPEDQNLQLVRARGFGVMSVNGTDGPLISHVPFIVNAGTDYADMHLVRSNPIVRLLKEPVRAVIAVSGPDAYISPDWYGAADQVPTWNYVAVHLRGELSLRPQEELRSHLDELAAHFEAQLLPKPPWSNDKMTLDALGRMMRMIVPVRLKVETVDGTWKLGQNKDEAARKGAAEGLEAAGFGLDPQAIACLMREAGDA